MATFFKNKVIKDVGVLPILAIDTQPGLNTTVIGLSLANLTDSNIFASVLVRDDTSVEGYFIKDIMVPPNSSLRVINGGEKLIIPSNNQLLVQSSEDNSLDAIISYVDIA